MMTKNPQDKGLKYSLAVERAEQMDAESLEREANSPTVDPTVAAAARETLIDRAGS